ncbi:MAG: uracil-DNA glycosylase [bacterium JZ-2024 1]
MALTLEALWTGIEEEIRACQKCPLGNFREQKKYFAVPGDGPKNARVLFIGEAPGEEEALQGLPFVGRAGILLSEMLAQVGISREKVYITNILKCRPPDNRNPEAEEVSACLPYLFAQIHLLQPKVICLLGKVALEGIFGPKMQLKDVRGKSFTRWGLQFFCTYHPAAVLHNPVWKRELQRDFFVLHQMLRTFAPEVVMSAGK